MIFYFSGRRTAGTLSRPRQFSAPCGKISRDTFQDSIITNEDCETLQRNLKAEHHDFWYFIVRFLVTTGARVSELVRDQGGTFSLRVS